MRDLLFRMLKQRFGTLPQPVLDRLAEIRDTKRLEQLTTRFLEARSLDDLDL